MNTSENFERRFYSQPSGPVQVSELVDKARAGDRSAFEQIMALYENEIFRMVFFRIRSKMDSEDLTQDIFMSAFRYLPQLKDSDRFRPWLFRIAINRVRDFHRKKKLLSLFGMTGEKNEEDAVDVEARQDPGAGALDAVIRQEFWAHVKRLSKRFSRMEKEVFFLRFSDDLNLREIALTLRKSESAVKTHLYRAIKKFKEDSAFSDFLQGDWHGEEEQPS